MDSDLKNRVFLRDSAAQVAVIGAVATDVTFGFTACGDKDDSGTTPVQTTTVTSTEEPDDDRGDINDGNRMSN